MHGFQNSLYNVNKSFLNVCIYLLVRQRIRQKRQRQSPMCQFILPNASIARTWSGWSQQPKALCGSLKGTGRSSTWAAFQSVTLVRSGNGQPGQDSNPGTPTWDVSVPMEAQHCAKLLPWNLAFNSIFHKFLKYPWRAICTHTYIYHNDGQFFFS